LNENNVNTAYRVSIISLAVNLVLSTFKFIAGFAAGSGAMVSDAVHSASDVASTIIVMIGIRLANEKPDSRHQYGHEKFECIAAVILSAFLFAIAIGIGYNGVRQLLNPGEISVPGFLALVAALVSIVVKEWMYWFTIAAAKKINSGALKADAWHHRSDALSSVGSLIGIGAARMGYPIMEPLASLIICLMIFKAAFDIIKQAFEQMVDTAADEKTADEIYRAVYSVNGVQKIDLLHTRMHANLLYVDVEIAVDGSLELYDSHRIAQEVHDRLEGQFPLIKHCMVHVNPYDNK